MFQQADHDSVRPGVLVADGIIDVGDLVPTMDAIIDQFADLRDGLQSRADTGVPQKLEEVRLGAPLPRPSKIMCCIANYWEHAQREPRPLNMFLKNPDAVVGPGDTIRLPEYTVPWMFMHEAELGIVIKGPARSIKQADWRTAVFGYTGMMDITGRGEGRSTWGRGTWLGKAFDTIWSIGPRLHTG